MVVRYLVRPKNRKDQRLYELFMFLGILAELPCLNLAFDESMDLAARRMDIYVEAKRDFLLSETAKAALGGSLRIGWPIGISGEIAEGNGNTTLDIPVAGTKGMANIEVSGVKQDGVWRIVDLHLTPQGTKDNIEIQH